MTRFVEEAVSQLTGADDAALVAFIDIWLADIMRYHAVSAYWDKLTESQQGAVIKSLGLDWGDWQVAEAFEFPEFVRKQFQSVIALIEEML